MIKEVRSQVITLTIPKNVSPTLIACPKPNKQMAIITTKKVKTANFII